MKEMVNWVAALALAMSVILFVLACLDLRETWAASKTLKDKAEEAVGSATTASSDDPQTQSMIDISEAWKALATLATALKDLERSTRFFVLSLAFLAVAALGSGLDQLAEAIAS